MTFKSTSKAVIFSFIVAAGLGILWLSSKVSGEPIDMTFSAVRYYFIPIAFILLVAIITGRLGSINIFGHVGKGLAASFYVLLAAAAIVGISYLLQPLGKYSPSSSNIIFFALACLLTAIFEEVMCRGIIQGPWLKVPRLREPAFWPQ